MLTLILSVALLTLHGGQYQQPVLAEPYEDGEEAELGLPPPVPSQPGTGPIVPFQAARWEWWFDFNQEGLLRVRERMAAALPAPGEPAPQAVDDGTRLRRVLPVLVEALDHPHRDMRAAAALSLGRLGLAAGLPGIQRALTDNDLFVRANGALAYGYSGQLGAVEPLAKVLHDRDQSSEMRVFAAVGLALTRQPEAVNILQRQLRPDVLKAMSNQLRWGLVYAAGVSEDPALVPTLLGLEGAWCWDHDATLRALAAVALGQIGSSDTVAPLLKLLNEKDNQVRRSAAAGLESSGRHLTEAEVQQLLTHLDREGDAAVHTNLLRVVAASGTPTGLSFLAQTLKHSTVLARSDAALSLGLAGDPAFAPLLVASLGRTRESSAQAALVLALGLLGAPETLPSVLEVLNTSRDPGVQGYAALAAGLLGSRDLLVRERLVALASESHDVDVVRLVILGLGLSGSRNALSELAASLTDPRLGTMDRAARIHGLGLVGDLSSLPALLAAAREARWPSYVRRYALLALGDVCDPRPLPPMWRMSRHVELNLDIDLLVELYRQL